MNGLDAWHELLGTFFEKGDVTKIEWAVGSAMSDGPRSALIIVGDGLAGGKTTTLGLIQMLFAEHWQRSQTPMSVSVHDDVTKDLPPNTSHTFSTNHTFLASNRIPNVSGKSLVVKATGKTAEFNRYTKLHKKIVENPGIIVEHCIEAHHNLGADYYIMENSK